MCIRDSLDEWWAEAAPLLVAEQGDGNSVKSRTKKITMAGEPRELAADDDMPAGQVTLLGTGHAVRLDAQVAGWYLTGVRIHGSRHGDSSGKKKFNVFVCDEKLNVIAKHEFSPSGFTRGSSKWLTFNMKPTRVPVKFVLCVEFPGNTEDGGVLVTRDGWQSGDSFTGVPGKKSNIPARGDWFIRALLDRPKDAAPLKPLK